MSILILRLFVAILNESYLQIYIAQLNFVQIEVHFKIHRMFRNNFYFSILFFESDY